MRATNLNRHTVIIKVIFFENVLKTRTYRIPNLMKQKVVIQYKWTIFSANSELS